MTGGTTGNTVGVDNYMTIDFEDWYQGLTSTSKLPDEWPRFEKRIEKGADWLLKTLDQFDTRATFFVLGRVAQEHPELVKRLADSGHEIGLHSLMHQRIDLMTAEEFREDLTRNIEAVYAASGVLPKGYRAPCFSISSKTDWFWDVLSEFNVLFDSSVFPIKTTLYGIPGASRTPYVVKASHGNVTEFPMSTYPISNINIPFSGGFYFRSMPYSLTRAMIRSMNRRAESVIFYCHPWEFDPDHPSPRSVTVRERLSHYGFLKRNREKFVRLLEDFQFKPLGKDLEESADRNQAGA